MGLLKTIFIIILVYYAFKVLTRIFAPFFIKFVAKKAEQRFSGEFGERVHQRRSKKEGEVIIDKIPRTKSSNKNVGDYVDFEEIE